jgi:hypothetical protein
MSITNNTFVNIISKKIFGKTDFKDKWFDYTKDFVKRASYNLFPVAGIVGENGILLSAGGDDRIVIEESGSELDGIGVDGLGNFLQPSSMDVADRVAYFENTAAQVYNVSICHCEIPTGVVVNPRTGYPDYDGWKEYIGMRAEPDAVTDNGDDTITFEIPNSVLEDGVDNKNRVVEVFLKVPQINGTTIDIARQRCTVTYSSGKNWITTDSAKGKLGQATISTTASDYYICLIGPNVWKTFDPSSVTTQHVPIGTVTGVGAGSPPTVFTTTAQDDRKVKQSFFGAIVNGLKHNLLPNASLTYNLGSASKIWATVFTKYLSMSDGEIITDITNGLMIATAATQKLGFFGQAPVVRGSNFTLTYGTADKTHAARTASTLTDNSGGGATDNTIGVIATGGNVGADIPDAIAELADEVNKLIADQNDTAQVLNSLINDLSNLGITSEN